MDLMANITPREDPVALVEHWMRYYRAEGVTRFHFFLNRYSDDGAFWPAFEKMLAAPDVKVVLTFEGVEDMRSRVELFRDYSGSELARAPFVMVADTDEFVRSPAWAASRLVERGWDFVPGIFVDRFHIDGVTAAVDADRPLPEQFPRCTSFTYEALGGSFTKVPIARPGIDYRNGFHGVRNDDALKKPDWYLPVNHFKWTAGLIQRIRDRIARKYGGDKYLLECEDFLERWVAGEDRIELARVNSWITLGW